MSRRKETTKKMKRADQRSSITILVLGDGTVFFVLLETRKSDFVSLSMSELTLIHSFQPYTFSLYIHRGRRKILAHLHLCLALLLGSRARHYDARPLAARSPSQLLCHHYY
jgi:hypothetical protein